ncbi:MAG: YitT family protein [Lachnospirales bacterium]
MDNIKEYLKRAFYINLGIFLVALGTHFFRAPNNFVFGGITGLSQTVTFYTDYSLSDIMFVLNTVVIILGFIFLKHKNMLGIIYGSYMLSFMVKFMEIFYPMEKPFTDDGFIEVIFAVFVPAIGSAILYREQLNTGGTEILAKIITKYINLKMHLILMGFDFIIVAFAGYTYGVEVFLYSALGLMLRTYIVDIVLDSFNLTKAFTIVTESPSKIADFIMKDLKHGATILNAYGGYTLNEKYIVTTTLHRRDAARLQLYLDNNHPTAFTTITNTSKVIGRGFAQSQ